MQSQTLYCTERTADKQYTVTLSPVEGGYTVVCFNGRRGGTQTTQTLAPVTLDAAEKLYARILKEKLAKGYQPGETAAAMTQPAPGQKLPPSNPYRPMLLNAIGPAEAERYLSSPDWFMQQKADGVRCIVQINSWQRNVAATSRTGKPVALTAEVTEALLSRFSRDLIFDGESCGDVLVIFDLLADGETDLRGYCCDQRTAALDLLARCPKPSCLSFMQTARTAAEKRAALQLLREAGAEGVVFKDRNASYSAGRPNSGGPGLKWKFIASASVTVVSHHVNGKRSVNMALADGTEVGAVTIPPNREVPAIGSVIEVEYLYAHRGGSLTQAVYKGIRSDVEPDGPESLQYKGEER